MQPTAADKIKEKEIQNRLTQEYKEARMNLCFKALSFVGMILLAVSAFVTCPPLLITGLLVTSLVASYYLVTNCEKIGNQLSKASAAVYQRFFQPDKLKFSAPDFFVTRTHAFSNSR